MLKKIESNEVFLFETVQFNDVESNGNGDAEV